MSTALRRRNLLTLLLETAKYLYNEGDKCTKITGGWIETDNATVEAGTNSLEPTNNVGTCTFYTSHITFSQTSTSSYSNPSRTAIVTSNKINTTGFNKLCIEWAGSATSKISMAVSLYTSRTTKELGYTTSGSFLATKASSAEANAVRQIDIVDISNYQGLYYIGAYFYKAAGVSNIHYGWVYRIWLEK